MIEGLKRKSRKAFHTLYRDYYAAMVVYALKFLKVKEEAEDAVQDVFLSLWEAEKPFDSIDNLRSFLYTSVKNRCLNILRERSVRRKYEEHIIDFYKEMENEEPIEQTYAEVLGEVYRLIDELPPRCREIFLLHMDGRKNEEIAQALDIAVNTVKAQKAKAVSFLKEQSQSRFFPERADGRYARGAHHHRLHLNICNRGKCANTRKNRFDRNKIITFA